MDVRPRQFLDPGCPRVDGTPHGTDSVSGKQISTDMIYTVNITRYLEIINHVIKNIQYFTLTDRKNNTTVGIRLSQN